MASKRQYTLELLLGAKTKPEYNSSLKNAEKALTNISSTAKKAAGLVTSAFAAVNISSAISSAVEEYSGFEQELTNTAAIAGASQAEYVQMENASREAGKATTKTAGESAAALGYMALAGWDVNESTSALMPVLKLSESTNLDLARTSDLVTDSMGALKIEVSGLEEYLDLVTKAQNSSNQTAEQMMEGYIRAGGAARSLGIDAKDTGTALGILANNGTKAGEGGRTLNAILTRIAANKEASKQIKKLGISIFDAKGDFVGFEEALKRMNKGLDGLTMQKQAKALKNIAGTQYYTKMKYLLDGVKEGANGSESAWDELERKLSHAEGTLDEMDKKITGTMSGSMQIMNSALSDAKISFGDAFKTEIVEVIQDFTGLFNGLSEGITNFADENEIKIHQTFEAAKDNITSAGEFIGDFASGVIDNFDTIETAVAGFVSMSFTSKFLKQFKAIKGSITGLINNFHIGTIASKASLLTAGLTIAAGAVTAIGVHIQNTHKKLVKSDLEGHFGSISLSLEDIDEISQQIVGKKKLVKISEMLESISKTDEAVQKMAGSMKEINKTSWKVRAGFKLDIDDRENYKASIENYIKSAQDVIDNQGYSVSVATDILFGKNSKISKKNNAFYSGLDAELATLEKKLNKKIGKAVESGVDIPTDKAIQKLLGKINTITTAITDAENEAGWQQLDLKYSGKDLTPETFKELSSDVQKRTEEANEGIYNAHNETLVQANAEKNMALLKLKEKRANKKISKTKYNKRVASIENEHELAVKDANQAYYDAKAKNMLKSSKYLMKSITDAYPEAEAAMEKLGTDMSKRFNEIVGNGIQVDAMPWAINNIIKDTLGSVDMPDISRDALSEIFKTGLGGIQSDMQEFATELKNSGIETTEAFGKGINDMQALAAVSGSTDDALSYFGNLIDGNDAWATIVEACGRRGANIPEQIGIHIEQNKGVVEAAIKSLLNTIDKNISGAGNSPINLNMAKAAVIQAKGGVSKGAPKLSLPWNETGTGSKAHTSRTNTKKAKTGSNGKLIKNAKGGIYSNPVFTILAEEGDSEAVIPLNNTSRAKALWHNAGKILGMEPSEDKALYNTSSVTSAKQAYKELEMPAVSISPVQLFTEEGSREAATSFRTGRTEKLWNNILDMPVTSAKQAYEGLEILPASSPASEEGNIYITCSPQITIKGNADRKVINEAFSISQTELARILDKYFANKKRVSFSQA